MTGARRGEVMASAISGATDSGKPILAAMAVQNFIKSRREMPFNLPLTSSKLRSSMEAPLRIRLRPVSL
jgi:hypothetical protein